MKKLIVGLLAAFLMTTGLVAFSGSPASARPSDCPYSGCVKTNTKTNDKVNKHHKAKIKVNVNVPTSNAEPKGRVTLTLTKIRKNGNLKEIGVYYGRTDAEGKITFKTDRLKRGKYAYAAEFETNEKRGFKYSSENGTFRVR